MPLLNLTKPSIDLALVTTNPDAVVAFYRDVIGLDDLGGFPTRVGRMHRLGCGTSVLKVVSSTTPPPATAAGGGIDGATGLRYWTIPVANLAEVVARCEAAGAPLPQPITAVRAGLTSAIVEDPDGNLVELLTLED
jgi:catechol 2,3-dioxygenase-like lactoylglutathione lyase family enzyme